MVKKKNYNATHPWKNYKISHWDLIRMAYEEKILSFSADAGADTGKPLYVSVEKLDDFVTFLIRNGIQ